MAGVIPAATMQRGAALPSGGSSTAVAVGAGAGGAGWPENGAGGALKVRHGITDATEIELGGQAVIHSCSGCDEDMPSANYISAAGRMGVKHALGRRHAWLGGVSYGGFPGGKAVGFDGGLVFDASSWFYGSLRAGVGVPVSTDDAFEEAGRTTPVTGWGALAAGARHRDFFVELGLGAVSAGDEDGVIGFAAFGVDVTTP